MTLLLANRALGCRELVTFITACLAIAMLGLLGAPPAHAADEPERLRVADPYLELHTGPGRGFPVFFVVARDEWVEVQLRSTDWFKVRTDGGKEGWVHRSQLANTFTVAGMPKSFRDVALDDYLARRLQMGAAWGEFKNEPMLKVWTSYRMSETLHLEGTIGQVQGTFSGTDIWHVNLLAEPLSDLRLSPFFSLGVGKFKNLPNTTLVGALPVDAKLANGSLGLRYYLTDRFIARADYTIYTAFVGDVRTGEYRAWTIGLAFFF
jgi:SH3-like domain-containing protein